MVFNLNSHSVIDTGKGESVKNPVSSGVVINTAGGKLAQETNRSDEFDFCTCDINIKRCSMPEEVVN